jgi:hypothetical protein
MDCKDEASVLHEYPTSGMLPHLAKCARAFPNVQFKVDTRNRVLLSSAYGVTLGRRFP